MPPYKVKTVDQDLVAHVNEHTEGPDKFEASVDAKGRKIGGVLKGRLLINQVVIGQLMLGLEQYTAARIDAKIMALIEKGYDRNTSSKCPTAYIKQVMLRLQTNASKKEYLELPLKLPERGKAYQRMSAHGAFLLAVMRLLLSSSRDRWRIGTHW
jgi:hypothetical protein